MTVWDWVVFAIYYVSFIAILVGYVWTIVLFITGYRYLKRWGSPQGQTSTEDHYLWVFFVPALNEGVTIADSVNRLRGVEATHKLIVVINDGSQDNTGEVLAAMAGPDLQVLTRVPPNARKGKAAALNAAFDFVRRDLLPLYPQFSADHVIFGIVDADGRLAPEAPRVVSRHFDDPAVGGVQVHVHIYNQTSWLTRMQGLEFRIFGGLFQVGRSYWGTAFLGGNGQFNRMTALEDVASPEGPWAHYLTEDQELGLRCLTRGFLGHHEPATQVAQQGVNDLRRLYRQRTRWFQGNLQVLRNLGQVNIEGLMGVRRLDVAISLVLPVLQIVVGLALAVAILMAVVFQVPYLPWGNPWLVAFFVQLSVGPTFLGVMVVARGHGLAGIPRALALALPYLVYTWVMWPVVAMGVWKQIRGNASWAKTEREPVSKAAQSGT